MLLTLGSQQIEGLLALDHIRRNRLDLSMAERSNEKSLECRAFSIP
jgi:hypothetical protein